MRQFRRRLPWLSCLALGLALAGCQKPVAGPPAHGTRAAASASDSIALAGRVTDAAHILPQARREALEQRLAALERSTHHQLVVVTVPGLGGEDIADYTRKLANRWGIGRKGYNDGVVLLVAPHERKIRIAVGRGLETRLTNAVCQTIIDRDMLPRFRAGDLPGGIEAGAASLSRNLDSRR